MRPSRQRTLSFALALGLLASPLAASASVGDVEGDRILGQLNPTSNTPNSTGLNASGLYYPQSLTFDRSGNLFVADTYNNRVLAFRSPMTSDRVADLVIGQPDFNSDTTDNGGISASSLDEPNDLAVTASGDLWVADTDNNRVLQFIRPFETDTVADFVIGQPDFESDEANYTGIVDAAGFDTPTDVAIDAAGNLWVTDYHNDRVLGYDNPTTTMDRLADRVLGQPSFNTNDDDDGAASAKTLDGPYALAIDSEDNLWIVDYLNNRVLEFDQPGTLDATADRILGQPNFTSEAANYSGQVDAAGFEGPGGVDLDANGNVYVSDAYNNRVLMYTAPIATGDRIADRVFGQPDFNSKTENNGGVSARTFYIPVGVAIDPNGNLAIADNTNHRVVLLQAPTPVVTSLQVKVAPATRKAKLVVEGFGMKSGSAVVEVYGVPLATTKYKLVSFDGSARRVVATDPNFNTLVPRGVLVEITIFNPDTGSRSAPIPFTR
jgi:sugar lactone lactonase YvrE